MTRHRAGRAGVDRGQSESIGVILLTAVVVVTVSAAGAYALVDVQGEETTNAEIAVTVTQYGLYVDHGGGESIPAADLKVVVRTNGTTYRPAFDPALIYDGDGDTSFEPGESWATLDYDWSLNETATVYVADERTGTLLFRETFYPDRNYAAGPSPVPVAAFDYEPSLPVAGEQVTFESDSTSFRGNVTEWDWDFDGDGIYEASGRNVTHAFGSPGVYSVTLRVENEDNRTDTVTREVRVNGPPTAAFDYSPDPPVATYPARFDAGNSSDSDGGALDYAWDFDGDGTTDATGEVVYHTFARAGTHTVALTVDDGEGFSNTTTRTVFVASNASWAVDAGGPRYVAGAVIYAADNASDPSPYRTGGTVATTSDGIADTTNDTLYDTQRVGGVDYDVPLTDGEYRVTLQFAEIVYTGDGHRVFDVRAEGTTLVDDLDVYARVGHDHALVLTRTVNVTDGSLNLSFVGETGDPAVGAVSVHRIGDAVRTGPDTEPPTVTVESPDGGEYVRGGSNYTITWSASDAYTGVEGVRIEYSTDNGSTWATVVANTTNDGAYEWSVPTDNTDQALVRVTATDGADNSASDASNATFTVDSAGPKISNYDVTNPSGQTLKVSFDANESLSSIAVEVRHRNGTVVTTLTEAEVTSSDSSAPYTYTGSYTTRSEGWYRLVLVSAQDMAGNEGASNESKIVFAGNPTMAERTFYAGNLGIGSGSSLVFELENIGETAVEIQAVRVDSKGSAMYGQILGQKAGSKNPKEIIVTGGLQEGYAPNKKHAKDAYSADGQPIPFEQNGSLGTKSATKVATVEIGKFGEVTSKNQGKGSKEFDPYSFSGFERVNDSSTADIIVTIEYSDGSTDTLYFREA